MQVKGTEAKSSSEGDKPVQQAEAKKAEIKVGDEAPNFTLLDQDGKKRKLSDFEGKYLVLYFFPKAMTPG